VRLRALADAYRILRGQLRPVWTGVYERYEDVPVSGPGFDGETWTAITRAGTERALARLRDATPGVPTGDRALLPSLVANVLADRGAVRIVDFGGGMGIGYIDVRAAMGPAAIEYVVVETDAVCAAGRNLFQDPAIRFVTSLADVRTDADLVYVSSVLQYMPKPTEMLRQLAALGARYLLLVNVSAGEIPTYATAQRNVPGSVIAYWFLATREIVEALRAFGYEQRHTSPSERRLTGFAVPRRYRIERGVNLLFERAATRD